MSVLVGTVLAAAEVDPVWLFVLAVICMVCGVVVVVQSVPGISITGVGLIAIGLAGMLAWWP